MVNVIVTFIRFTLYVLSALFAARYLFKKLNINLIYSNMKFFDKNPIGRIMNRISNDVIVIDDELPWNGSIFIEYLV